MKCEWLRLANNTFCFRKRRSSVGDCNDPVRALNFSYDKGTCSLNSIENVLSTRMRSTPWSRYGVPINNRALIAVRWHHWAERSNSSSKSTWRTKNEQISFHNFVSVPIIANSNRLGDSFQLFMIRVNWNLIFNISLSVWICFKFQCPSGLIRTNPKQVFNPKQIFNVFQSVWICFSFSVHQS